MAQQNIPREILEQNIQELTEQLYGCYQRITFLNEQVAELDKENRDLKQEIEELANERT